MNKEQAQQIVSDLRKMENSAQVVLDSGFGTHEGEHDTIYRKRRDLAKNAADLIESLQREAERNIPMKATRQIASERTKDPANGGIFGKGVTIWFCPKCGIFNTPTHNFCWKCGQALEFDTPATEPKGDANETD